MFGDTVSENRRCFWSSPDTGVACNKQIRSPFPNFSVHTSKSFMSVKFSLHVTRKYGAVKYFETQHQEAVSDQLNAPPLYPWGKCSRYPSNRRLVGRQVWSEYFVEETNLITLPRIEPRFLCRSARSLRHYNDYVTRAPQLNGNISSSFVDETWQLHPEDMTQRKETEKAVSSGDASDLHSESSRFEFQLEYRLS